MTHEEGGSSRLTPLPGYSACRLLMVSSIEGPLADLCSWVRWVAARWSASMSSLWSCPCCLTLLSGG